MKSSRPNYNTYKGYSRQKLKIKTVRYKVLYN